MEWTKTIGGKKIPFQNMGNLRSAFLGLGLGIELGRRRVAQRNGEDLMLFDS